MFTCFHTKVGTNALSHNVKCEGILLIHITMCSLTTAALKFYFKSD